MTAADSSIQKIRKILKEHAWLDINVQALTDDCDLYQAGMSSSANVSVMFALEQEFGITFPDEMLDRSMFGKISAINAGVLQLLSMQSRSQAKVEPQSAIKKFALAVFGSLTNFLWVSSDCALLESALYPIVWI